MGEKHESHGENIGEAVPHNQPVANVGILAKRSKAINLLILLFSFFWITLTTHRLIPMVAASMVMLARR